LYGASDNCTTSDKQIEEMQHKCSNGVLIKDLMAIYKLSKASVYRLLTAEAQSNKMLQKN